MRHDTKTVHAFTCKVISYIKENLHAITKVLYFSDGAASQYKNFKNFVNLCYHEIDHSIQAQWHFFATSHGKSPYVRDTLSLVYSTAEYCAPVWCRSAHTRLIDSVLNDALRIVTGCLRPTPTDHLPIGIQPAELRRMGATLSLAYRGSLDPDHILHGL